MRTWLIGHSAAPQRADPGARPRRGPLPLLAGHVGGGRGGCTTASFGRAAGTRRPLPVPSACAARTQLRPGLVSARARGTRIRAASARGVRTEPRVLRREGAERGARAGERAGRGRVGGGSPGRALPRPERGWRRGASRGGPGRACRRGPRAHQPWEGVGATARWPERRSAGVWVPALGAGWAAGPPLSLSLSAYFLSTSMYVTI